MALATLSTQHEAELKDHCVMFLKLLECVQYLARQCVPLSGHHEDSPLLGNIFLRH